MIYQTTSTRLLIEAAKRLGFPYKIFDENGNLVEVETKEGKLLFANYGTPFNTDSFSKIAKDKGFTNLILKEVIKMPKTVSFFDPNYNEGGELKSINNTLENITEEISKNFDFPMVIKPRSLSRGRNFSICNNRDEISAALKKVFEKNQNYDYVALSQEYIKPKHEYRVVVFKNEIILVYTVKKEINDETTRKEVEAFIKPIFGVLEVGFAGLDIIEAENGQKYLLEINAEPGFANFVEKNGDEPIIEMYCKILKS
ncbi:MAG TPA: hypothetical protein VJI33_02435 [Candidatus Paceibacterota bacterium]